MPLAEAEAAAGRTGFEKVKTRVRIFGGAYVVVGGVAIQPGMGAEEEVTPVKEAMVALVSDQDTASVRSL